MLSWAVRWAWAPGPPFPLESRNCDCDSATWRIELLRRLSRQLHRQHLSPPTAHSALNPAPSRFTPRRFERVHFLAHAGRAGEGFLELMVGRLPKPLGSAGFLLSGRVPRQSGGTTTRTKQQKLANNTWHT